MKQQEDIIECWNCGTLYSTIENTDCPQCECPPVNPDEVNEGREYDDFVRNDADHKNLYSNELGEGYDEDYLTDDEQGLTQM